MIDGSDVEKGLDELSKAETEPAAETEIFLSSESEPGRPVSEKLKPVSGGPMLSNKRHLSWDESFAPPSHSELPPPPITAHITRLPKPTVSFTESVPMSKSDFLEGRQSIPSSHPASPPDDIPTGLLSPISKSRARKSSFDEPVSNSEKRLSRRGTTNAMALTVQDYLERKEDLEVGEGIPLFELLKASRKLKSQRKSVEGLFYFVFMLVFAILVIRFRQSSLAGETAAAIIDLFLDEEFSWVDHGSLAESKPYFKKNFYDIMTQEEWWQWALGPVVSAVFFSDSLSVPGGPIFGVPIPQSFGQLYMLGGDQGGVLLRTARVPADNCAPEDLGVIQPCFGPWVNGEGDRQGFGNGLPVSPEVAKAFTYRAEGGGATLLGTFLGGILVGTNDYGSSGYYIDLPVTNKDNRSVEALQQLFDNGWLDQQTRVASLEFNVYNPVTKIISCVRLFTEFSHTSMVRPSYRLYHLNAIMWEDGGGTSIFLAVVFFILLAGFSVKWIHAMVVAPKALDHMQRFQVVFDFFILMLFWISTVWIVVLTSSSEALNNEKFKTLLERQTFSPLLFDDAQSYHDIDAFCAVNLMLATVKLIGYLPFKTTRTIWTTLGVAAKDILVLGIVIAVFWFGFSIGSHVTFGPLGFYEFERIDRTFGTLMALMFSGSLNFNAMRQVSFLAAPIFYAVYMIFMWGVMLNLFVAIIVITYERYSDVQQNFDNWAREQHGTENGSLVMTIPERWFHYCKIKYFRFRRRLYGFKDDPFVDETLERRTKRLQQDSEALGKSMEKVLNLPIGPEREVVARLEGFPFRKYFAEKVRQVIWLREVKRTRRFLKMYYEDEDTQSSLIRKWRKEFDFARGDRSGAYSVGDCLSNTCCGKCTKEPIDADDDDTSDIDLFKPSSTEVNPRSFISRHQRSSSSAPGSSYSMQQKKEALRMRNIVLLSERIRRDSELMRAKLSIEAVLQETQALFRQHRLSFNRILRLTWDKTNNEERLHELLRAELREMLSPGCMEDNIPCRICSDAVLESRTDTLIANYNLLKKRRQVYIERLPRFRRLTLRSKPLQFDDTHSVASSYK